MGLFQSRFRLFRHDSRSILACFGRFGCRSIQLDSTDTVRFYLVWHESKPSWCESVEKKKKKIAQTRQRRVDSRVRRRTLRRTPVRHGGTLTAMSMLHRCSYRFIFVKYLKQSNCITRWNDEYYSNTTSNNIFLINLSPIRICCRTVNFVTNPVTLPLKNTSIMVKIIHKLQDSLFHCTIWSLQSLMLCMFHSQLRAKSVCVLEVER